MTHGDYIVMKKTSIKSSITETHDRWHKGHIEPFWTAKSYKKLNYQLFPFPNEKDLVIWRRQGYVHPSTHYSGMLCDMRETQAEWNDDIIQWFADTYSAKDVGTSYYRMGTDVILPTHQDTYFRYRDLYNTALEDCFRVIIFLADWSSGHMFEIDNTPVTNWKAGDYVYWESDVPHIAANMGLVKRYTLQLTGHK